MYQATRDKKRNRTHCEQEWLPTWKWIIKTQAINATAITTLAALQCNSLLFTVALTRTHTHSHAHAIQCIWERRNRAKE